MNFLQRLFWGRRGVDALSVALLLLAVVMELLGGLGRPMHILWYLSYLPLAFALYRSFSRNILARSRENETFLRWVGPLRGSLTGAARRFADRKTHCYFRCPSCKTRVRVPRGRGKICITCPHCHREFIKKT